MPENLIEQFEDTLHRCESEALRDATRQAMEGTKVYREDFRAQQPLMPRYERRITVENTTPLRRLPASGINTAWLC